MVNFFIGRPIFATVLALLMLLIGGICVFLLPIALYPADRAAPGPGHDDLHRRRRPDRRRHRHHADRAADQRRQGADLLQLRQHQQRPVEHRRHVRRRLLDQDIAAVDIQNKVQTAQAQLPPEVKQYGVTIKKTSTDMVCVVNLISPDGRYDATFLDNYGQINVADVLKRIPGVSDVNAFGRKYAMRIWLDPDRMANQRIAPAEVIQAIQQENKQAAAGKIGGLPVPAGPGLRVPDHRQGAAREGRASSRRSSSAATTTARSSASRTSPASSSTRRTTRRPAGSTASPPATIPIYQYADANALDIVKQVRDEMDRLGQELPGGPRYRIAYDTTHYVRREHQRGRAHARRGVRAGDDRRVRVPPGLPGHDHPDDRDPGLAGRHVRDDGGVRVLDQHADALRAGAGDRPGGRRRDHRGRERREVPRARACAPLEATRAAMAEITAPIVTITLVLAAVFVPVAFIPGLTGRLYNQFAMTIVFSFLFSAFNSLTFSPAMARLFLRPKHGETKFFLFRWFNRGLKWLEDSYDSFLDFDGPPLVDDRRPVARPAGADRLDDRRAAQGVHPDRGPGLPDRRRPDARRHQPASRPPGRPARRARSPGSSRASATSSLLDG